MAATTVASSSETSPTKNGIHQNLQGVQLLRDRGLSLLRESNTMIPIGHLSVELLSAIFVEVDAAEYEAEKTTRTRIHISCVSHHWRTVALSTPALWRRLVLRDYGDIPGIRESMARSKKLALDLDLLAPPWYEEEDEKLHREPYRWGNEDAKVLLDQLSRARSLHVDASPETSRGLNWPKVSQSLKHLRLNDTNSIDEQPAHRRRYKRLDLLDRIDNTFPNLQSLEITNHDVSLADLCLPTSLVNLRIVNIQGFYRDEGADDILDVLRDLPLLEHLSLINATTILDANAPEPSKPVSLPGLKTFSYKGPLSTCLVLVKSLELPHSARRSFTVEGSEAGMARFGNELIAELAKWETRFDSVIAHCSVGLKWMAWKQRQPVEDLESLAPLVMQRLFPLVANDDDHSASSADLQIHFMSDSKALRYELLFAHVKTLVFSFRYPLPMPSFLTHLGELEVMSCTFQAPPTYSPEQRFFLNERNPPLPRLRALRLLGFAFVKENHLPLLALCQERQKAGKKLDVHLLLCYEVSQTHLDELRAVNHSVTWDEQKPYYRNGQWW